MPVGAVQQDLAGHISWANLLTSLLFCAAHFFHKPLVVVFGLMPVSLVLGASLERSQRLWVPVTMHVYFNLLLYGASAALAA
jgi:membrane protease YdiL (CAAX protease family)